MKLSTRNHYTEVYKDHIERVVNIKKTNLEHPDVSFYFRQISTVTGKEQKIRGKVTRVEINKYIGTRFLFPTSLFLTKVENIFEQKGEGCLLTTNLHFTFLSHFFKKSKQKVVEHITGELRETKRILENQEDEAEVWSDEYNSLKSNPTNTQNRISANSYHFLLDEMSLNGSV